MFGYVTIRKDDLKVKDYNKYQAYYCGLCQYIKEAYGKKGQAMLTFDMTFLSILLTGLYECAEQIHKILRRHERAARLLQSAG